MHLVHLGFSRQPSCIMNVRHGTAADPPGAYIHDTSSAPPPSKFRTPPPNLGIINVLTQGGRWPPIIWQT